MSHKKVGLIVGKMSAFDMNALDNRIRELVAYARERDGEDRTTLFRNLVDLFLTGKAPSREPTRAQLLDVIEALLPHVEAESRRTAAELIASMSRPPLDLALRLSRDRASLVGELLKNMPFDEDAFIGLIRATGREHHQVLASRSDLSANVWIALARAAPAAPPFDSQSTLALWRDDLGNHRNDNVRPSATVTPLHPQHDDSAAKPAALRILRTGEDLIAERRDEAPHLPEPAVLTDVTDTAPETPEGAGEEPSEDASETPAPKVREKLRDPGPGGWSWRSDRDGFVIDVSPHGIKLLGGEGTVIGTAMLDLLGLNTKLGHPVSRAFQRRSTIHDSPILLEGLDKAHRHWTLEAAPLFSPCGGVFEGYEGILTPVMAGDEPVLDHDHHDDEPLFLDDPIRPERPMPATFLNQATVMATTARTQITGTPTPQETGMPDAAPVVAATARETRTEPAQTPEMAISGIPQATSPEILATLDLLDEAINRLTDGARKGGNIQLRLQAEIATACARSLREQLKSPI